MKLPIGSSLRLPSLLLLFLLTAATPAFAAAPLSVSATLGRTSATLGDFLEYTITVSAEPGAVTTISGVATALATAGFETIATTGPSVASLDAAPASTAATGSRTAEPKPDAERTTRTGDFDVTVRTWRVAAFKLGAVEVAGARLRYKLPGGKEGEQAVPAVPLTVTKVALPGNMQPGEDQVFGVKPPLMIPAKTANRWLLAAAIVLLGFLVALAIWKPDLLARLFGRGPAAPAPPRPAHVIALEALDLLVSEGLLERGLAREYFGRLSEILRGYLDARFALRSLEATTDELTPVLRRHPYLGKQWLEPLRKFLMTCDLAKFARHVPPRPLTDELTGLARKLVRETIVQEEAAAESGPKPPGETPSHGEVSAS